MAASETESSSESEWSVYLLQCADGTLYTGVTTDVKRRLRQHNGELKGGASYTRARRPVTIVWCESCSNRSDAQRREAQIRRLSRREKLAMVDSHP